MRMATATNPMMCSLPGAAAPELRLIFCTYVEIAFPRVSLGQEATDAFARCLEGECLMTIETDEPKAPKWLWLAGGFGLLWNAYGFYQFIGSFRQTKDSLMAVSMTAAQAELYLSLPGWISAAFAVGVIGGLAGSVALLMRSAQAVVIFWASMAGYITLFSGDLYYGVFANIPTQLVILTIVVLIAAGLLGVSLYARKQNLLTQQTFRNLKHFA